ncbi:hypothetical protein ACFZAM_19520 [Streptomyces sp. NPDC008079]|uniref:hypothetical protein n=1 Tax=Streptomyces sp. NPDC008079 TaxID=3364806 RepID=UPI0036E0E445
MTRLPGAAAAAGTPGAAGAVRRGLDLPGLVVLGAAVTLLTVPLVLGQEEGWPLWGWFSLGLSVLLFALFTVLEARLARRGGAPLVSARVLRAPGMPRAVTVISLTMAANAGFLFAIALHLQSGLGDSALRTGLTFATCAVAFGAVGLNWRRLPVSWRPWLAPAGLLVAAGSFAGLGLALRGGGHGGGVVGRRRGRGRVAAERAAPGLRHGACAGASYASCAASASSASRNG